jgi:hypothetical protein
MVVHKSPRGALCQITLSCSRHAALQESSQQNRTPAEIIAGRKMNSNRRWRALIVSILLIATVGHIYGKLFE